MNKFHESVQPCQNYGTPHVCYACACAQVSLGVVNDTANALTLVGYNVFIEQTGGMCMLGVLESGEFWIGFNDESVYVYENNYYKTLGDDADETAKRLVSRNDDETNTDFTARVLDVITKELATRS